MGIDTFYTTIAWLWLGVGFVLGITTSIVIKYFYDKKKEYYNNKDTEQKTTEEEIPEPKPEVD